MGAWILMFIASLVFAAGRQGLPNNEIGENVLKNVMKRVSTNAKTELWKNVANFIDRYSPLKNGNEVFHEQMMKDDIDKLLYRMGPLPFPWGRLGLRPTLM